MQADLRLCWSHIPHCWKSHVVAHMSECYGPVPKLRVVTKMFAKAKNDTSFGQQFFNKSRESL